MHKPIVVVSDPVPDAVLAELRAHCAGRRVDGRYRTALLTAVTDAVALLVRSATRVDREVLERAPLLKVVGRAGVGLDNMDVDSARYHAVAVVNAPGS